MPFFSKWKNCNAALQFCVTMTYYPVFTLKLRQLVAVFDGASLHSCSNSMALSFYVKDSKEFHKPNSDWIPLATLFNHCRGCGIRLNPPNPRTTGAMLNWTAPRLEIELQNATRFSGFLASSFPNNPDLNPSNSMRLKMIREQIAFLSRHITGATNSLSAWPKTWKRNFLTYPGCFNIQKNLIFEKLFWKP